MGCICLPRHCLDFNRTWQQSELIVLDTESDIVLALLMRRRRACIVHTFVHATAEFSAQLALPASHPHPHLHPPLTYTNFYEWISVC